jgi:quinol monooxygenase YgiN
MTPATANVSFKLVVEPAREEGVLAAFRSQLTLVRCRPGYRASTLELDAARPGGICFSSTWESEAALRGFLSSRIMDRVLQLLELSVEQPEIHVCERSGEAGLAFIRSVRNGELGDRNE